MQPLAAISLSITVAMMLMSAIQAGFGGRPELVVDALKEGPKAIVATALTVVVMDVLIRGADALVGGDLADRPSRHAAGVGLDRRSRRRCGRSGGHVPRSVGAAARDDRVADDDRGAVHAVSAAVSGGRVLADRVGVVGVAGDARLGPPAGAHDGCVGAGEAGDHGHVGGGGEAGRQRRRSRRRATASAVDGAAALGTLVTGFACFAIAGLSPWVVYRLLPSVEQAAVASGVVGGWGRAGMTAVQAGLMVKSLGASAAASSATRGVSAMSSSAGSAGAAGGGVASIASGWLRCRRVGRGCGDASPADPGRARRRVSARIEPQPAEAS